jgi:hypothetical protein
MTPDTAHLHHPHLADKHALTPKQLARVCLAEGRNNPDRAIAFARRRASGTRLRATIAAIAGTLLRGRPV